MILQDLIEEKSRVKCVNKILRISLFIYNGGTLLQPLSLAYFGGEGKKFRKYICPGCVCGEGG